MAQPPHGMSEEDYEAIEAAVTETVRGRWFLGEFARRNRSGEMQAILDAIGRIEGSVDALGSARALPPADPSVRLLMQRVREISGRLDRLAGEMRLAGAAERFAGAVEDEGRAVAGMMRAPALPPKPASSAAPRVVAAMPEVAPEAAPGIAAEIAPCAAAEAPPALPPPATRPVRDASRGIQPSAGSPDPRLRHLEEIDRLPMAEKLALFA